MRILPTLLVVFTVATAVVWWARSAASGAGPAAPAAPQGALAGGRPQGHVYTGVAEEPGIVNPFTCQGQVARRLVLGATHEGLLDVDPVDGSLRPAAAERFELAADGQSCVFTLREGLRFADGTAVTLDDALFGWELATAGHVQLGFVGDAYSRVRAVERLDARTFRVAFRDQHFAVLRVVGERWLVVSRAWFVAQVAARHGGTAPPVASAEFAALLMQIERECGPGTGPYRLDNDPKGTSRWRPRQDLLLVRNDHCWRRTARPGTWNFAGMRLLFRDAAGETNALLHGELDWFSSAALDDLLRARPELTRDYRRLQYDYDALGVYRVIWNCRSGPTADVRVRRALAMLFDIAGWRAGNEGLGPQALAHAKPGSPAYPAVEPLPFDPSAARRLLREAGFDAAAGRPLQLTVFALQGTDALRRISDLFEHAARQAGIELDLRRREFASYMQEKQVVPWHGLLVQQQFRPWGDPWDFLHSKGTDNEGGFADAEVDRLADAARTTLDPAARAALWRELHTLVYREQPAALLAHPLASILLHRRLEGVQPGVTGLVLESGWVAPANQRQ